jgi:hypothetical protein
MNLYRLKSNTGTIVKRVGKQFHRVVWSSSMKYGYNCRWMIGHWLPDNVIPLNKEEMKELRKEMRVYGHDLK